MKKHFLLPVTFVVSAVVVGSAEVRGASHYEDNSLFDTVSHCLHTYVLYSNPAPFWEDRDFCSVRVNPFIDGADVSSRWEGRQLDVIDVLRQIKNVFNHPDSGLSRTQRDFAEDLEGCINNYSEVQSTETHDFCFVSPNPSTAVHWGLAPGWQGRRTLVHALEATLEAMPDRWRNSR